MDEANNQASFMLTTMVVDTQAPVLQYRSNYNQTAITATHVCETVEASLKESYVFGQLSAVDPPFMQALPTAALSLTAPVDRGK